MILLAQELGAGKTNPTIMILELFIESADARYKVCKSVNSAPVGIWPVVYVNESSVCLRVSTCVFAHDVDAILSNAGLSAEEHLTNWCVNSENLVWSRNILNRFE